MQIDVQRMVQNQICSIGHAWVSYLTLVLEVYIGRDMGCQNKKFIFAVNCTKQKWKSTICRRTNKNTMKRSYSRLKKNV